MFTANSDAAVKTTEVSKNKRVRFALEPKEKEWAPVSLLLCSTVQNVGSKRMLKVLFDSGGTGCLINQRALPMGANPIVSDKETLKTIAGNFVVNRKVYVRDIILPEFSKSRQVDGHEMFVFNEHCPYDVILGCDFLKKIGLKLDFESGIIEWMDDKVAMKDRHHWNDPVNTFFALLDDDELDGDDAVHESFANILDAKYEKTKVDDVVSQQTHLNDNQKTDLKRLLDDFTVLFDGNLGKYPHEKVHLEFDGRYTPVHARPYAVPQNNLDTFEKELNHLNDETILEEVWEPTEWASPTFIVPKKDGRVRWLTDFRELNKALKRKVHNLPLITDILRRKAGYKYCTKLDLSMMYYCFELDEESKKLCTIVSPFGYHRYNRLAMGLKVSPDIAQSIMEKVLRGLDVDVYIDDIGIFTKTWEDHMKVVRAVLQRLKDNGFKVNPLKCEWAVEETDFLGYWMTPTGLKPWKKKISAVLKLLPPTNTKQLRSFIGAVTYYRDMWPRRSHVLAPLTELTGKGKWEWTQKHEQAFKEMKAIIASECLMAYPDPNKPFDVYTDASDYQLGAAILQEGKPVAYWSKKLNAAQKNYTTQEKELLSAVLVLKEFRSMLLGTEINVWTDHKNLTFNTLNTQRVLRWRLFLEDFAPTFRHIAGNDNTLADCFSRLPMMDKPTEGKSSGKGKPIDFSKLQVPVDNEVEESFHFNKPPSIEEINEEMPCQFSCCKDVREHGLLIAEDEELRDCFLYYPMTNEMQNPITVDNIQQHQFEDQLLNQLAQQQPYRFPIQYVENKPLICYRKNDGDVEGDWKIALPNSLAPSVVRWYHEMLGHCGSQRLYNTIKERFQYPNLIGLCNSYVCDTCQKNKQIGVGYGLLPPRHAAMMPWDSVAVDLVGPWKINVNNQDLEFNALTCIDPVTNLVEMVRIDNKTSRHIADKFANLWLARYPRPNKCIHDNGGEFIGMEFQELLQQAGVKDGPTTRKNPQSNAVCERMHQTVGNMLRTTIRKITTTAQAEQAIDNALASAMHATRCSYTKSIGMTPGAMAFHRDMFFDLPIVADLLSIRDERQGMIDENLRRQNAKRREYNYQVGEPVLLKSDNPNKLEPKAHGPYPILQTHTNGTVTILRKQHVAERINIRRIIPYKQ